MHSQDHILDVESSRQEPRGLEDQISPDHHFRVSSSHLNQIQRVRDFLLTNSRKKPQPTYLTKAAS